MASTGMLAKPIRLKGHMTKRATCAAISTATKPLGYAAMQELVYSHMILTGKGCVCKLPTGSGKPPSALLP